MNKVLRMQLLAAVKSSGSYDPNESLPYVEENMTAGDLRQAEAFLNWCVKNGRQFGHGNIDEVYADFRKGAAK